MGKGAKMIKICIGGKGERRDVQNERGRECVEERRMRKGCRNDRNKCRRERGEIDTQNERVGLWKKVERSGVRKGCRNDNMRRRGKRKIER